MSNIIENLEHIESNIANACARSRRSQDNVTLVVVTKTASPDTIKEVVRAGYCELGENKAQHLKLVHDEIAQFLDKKQNGENLPTKVRLHMIGHLQRNKVRQVLKMSSFIHSVDTLRLAEEVSRTAEKIKTTPSILIQVNCSKEPQKYGVPVGAAIHLAEQIATMPNVRLAGIMTMGPLTQNEDLIRAGFVRAREIFEDIKTAGMCGNHFKHLSMGMSNDYEIAVEEGATILRIGSAVFR